MTIWRGLSIVWSLVHVLVLFVFLYESRYSRKKTLWLTLLTMGPLCILNVALYVLLGPEKMGQLLFFSCILPSLVFFYLMAKHRDGRFFFTFCLADTVSYWVIFVTCLMDYYLGGDRYILMFIGRLLAFPLMEFLAWKYLRQRYHEMQRTVEKGWGSFAVVSAVFYVLLIVMSDMPTIITSRPEDVPASVLLLVLMPLIYLNIFQILSKQQKLYQAAEESRILRLQSNMLSQQTEHIGQVQEQMRIHRHDLRHQLLTVMTMLEKGEAEQARRYLTTAEKALENTQALRWCSNPVLDAVFAVYFRRAEAAGIPVEADLAIGGELPIDAAELSTVFANALENAVNACGALPPERRYIRCKCLPEPQFMFQITNPYAGAVRFDPKGRPLSDREGHGIGTRSITAFCEKHGAHYEYKAEKSVFSLRILMME